MNINLICTDENWILGRMARELTGLPATIGINSAAPPDIDYCIPYTLYHKAQARIRVALYTHVEPDNYKKMERIAESIKLMDYGIALSDYTVRQLQEHFNYTPDRVIHLGSGMIAGGQTTFGVSGNGNSSRKNSALISFLHNRGYRILYHGKNWGLPPEMEVEHRGDFYRRINYLIIPSIIEGGPVPLMDAIALRIPVIAPPVGWCADYPVIPYPTGDSFALERICRKLTKPRTWDDCRKEHQLFFTEIFKKRS